ncbi:MAG TPA: hypothetical protein VNW04_11935, partial [Puia sp.]|nr:hypothetical protein [Puia sp.]
MSPFLFPPILVYLLKMTLVSTCLYGYYWFFLRNAAFHVYNRCYLLASIAIALLLPLIHLPAAWSEAAHFIIPAKSGPPLPALP